jgi:putative DNA primase/helicase
VDDRTFLDGLDILGTPIFVLPRAAEGTSTAGLIKGKYRSPKGWSGVSADDNTERLDKARNGDAYGVVCGSTYDVIDVDPRNGGDTSFAEMVALGVIPQVQHVVSTPGGGFHLYIEPLGVGKHTGFRPGIDLQAAGSFVFAPPTNGYSVVEPFLWPELGSQLPDSPARLREYVLNPVKKKTNAVEISPPARAVGIPPSVVHAQIKTVLETLDALAALPEGERLPWVGVEGGVGWDMGGLYAAERLVEASNSGAGYSLEEAKKDFLKHSPQASGTYSPTHKWSEAVKYVGDKPLPYEDALSVFGTTLTDEDEDGSSPSGEIYGGQLKMAYRLANGFAGKLLFIHGVGWHFWDGTRWAVDDRGRAERAVIATLRKAIIESLGGDKKLRTDVSRCESSMGIKGVLTIAATLEEFAFTTDHMDADPYLINCANGTLDLRDRTLRPHDPADRCTKIARGAYTPGLNSAAWDTFLEQVLPEVEERNYLQRVIGQSCYGGVREHLFPVLTGTGANGKGTAYSAICGAMGDYAAIINPDMLMVRDRGGIGGPEMMVLRGARLVVASELGRERTLDDSLMKRLTGGDRLTARHLFKEPVTWLPSHQLVYVSNHKPKTDGDDEAIWRRMRIIPFDIVIPPENRDVTLGETLTLHADAIFTWAVEGFFDYEDNGGMREPASVLNATHAYRQESNDLSRFIIERCEVGKALQVSVGELWVAWLTWRDEEGCEVLSKKAFGQGLEKRGFKSAAYQNVRVRKGISLRSGDLEEEE